MKITALAGGVGGAKLAHGFSKILTPEEFSVVVNTGDDFTHYGLRICPDVDTVTYTLADLANAQTGWGREAETFNTLEALKQFSGPGWFILGDKDLALHLERTRLLAKGISLTTVTRLICKALGVDHQILPMSDACVRTKVRTKEQGLLDFQRYFVEFKYQPVVEEIIFEGVETAEPTEAVIRQLIEADFVVLCPSNPYLSIDPILSLNGVRDLLRQKTVLGVSPIIGGNAVKGPLAKMMRDFKKDVSQGTIIKCYADFLDYFVIDSCEDYPRDAPDDSSIMILKENILLPNIEARVALAKKIIEILVQSN